MQKASTTFKRVTKDLDAGIISEGSIRALRKALHSEDRKSHRLSTGATAPKCAGDELAGLLERIEREKPRITELQANKGIAWLRNLYKTPKGAERKNNPFNNTEAEVLESFTHFVMVGFEEVGNGYGLSYFIPIYCVYGAKGFFEYSAGSWQSGINITIY